MQRYEFTVTLAAEAESAGEAWEEAILSFALDPGSTPEPSAIEEIKEEANL